MKYFNMKYSVVAFTVVLLGVTSCNDLLDNPLERQAFVEETDYTKTEDMYQLLTGAYATFYALEWETFPLVSVRGDDVNAAGDQLPLLETDEFRYDRSFWMYNSVWLNLYSDIISFYSSIEEIERFWFKN